MRHVHRTLRVVVDWFIDRINPNQVCLIQKQIRHSDKRQFHAWWVAHLVASLQDHERHHIFLFILFFQQESNLKCRKHLRKAFHLVRQWWKRKHVVSFRNNACLWTQEVRGVQDVKCSSGREEMKNPDGILFSMLRVTESMVEVQKMLEVSQKRMLRETESRRDKSSRTSKTKIKSSRKYGATLRNISMWTRFMASSMQALHMDPICWEHQWFVRNCQDRWLSDIQKLKMKIKQ